MGKVWELDFYSRPIIDDRGKKQWEVLICETPQTVVADPQALFQYSQFCDNSEVNSVWLKSALQAAIAAAGTTPMQIRFFRRQMNNMITRACQELGIEPKPSRRTVALNRWLETRLTDVYPQMEGYEPTPNPSVAYAPTPPQPLPDALRGQQWAFVTLTAQDFADMPEWEIGVGEAFPLSLAQLAPDQRVPGVLIFSTRAPAIAAWMSGLELAYLYVSEGDRPSLILETGVNDGWIVADLPTATLQTEAEGFTQTKLAAQGVHFIAIQTDPDAEAFAGFWVLQELHLA